MAIELPEIQEKGDQSVALRVRVFPTGLWYKNEISSIGTEKQMIVLCFLAVVVEVVWSGCVILE